MQTQDRTFRVPAISDRQVLKAFQALASLQEDSTFRVVIGGVRKSDISTAGQFVEANPAKWDKSRVINRAEITLGAPALEVIFQRSTTIWDSSGHPRQTPSAWESEFYLSWSGHNGEPEADLRIQISSVIAEFQFEQLPASGPADAFSQAMALHVSRMAELQASILEDAEASRRAQNKAFEQRRAELEVEQSALLGRIQASELETRDRLAAEEARLEARNRELDDRGHMHARRQMRGEITADLKTRLERPGVSKQASSLRSAVFTVALIGIALFSAAAVFGLGDLHAQYVKPAPDPIVLGFASLRFALPAAAAAGLLFYLLGWLRKLHSEDVSSERDLERYRYDLDRASWAIETILEAQGKEGGTVPPEWINGVTHGLFARTASSNEEKDAADALGSLLNFAAKAEFGPGGPRIAFERKDLRRLSREATDA